MSNGATWQSCQHHCLYPYRKADEILMFASMSVSGTVWQSNQPEVGRGNDRNRTLDARVVFNTSPSLDVRSQDAGASQRLLSDVHSPDIQL